MSRRGQYLLFSALLISDAAGVTIGLLTPLFVLGLFTEVPAVYIAAIQRALPAYLLIFAALRLYDLETVLENSQEYATVATGCTYGILGLVVLNVVAGAEELERSWFLAGWVATIVAVGLGRFLMRRVVRALRRAGHLITRAIIVGADEQGRTIARQFRAVASSGARVVGFVDDFLPVGTPVEDGLRVLGHPSNLASIAAQHGAREVVVVPGAVAWETFHELLNNSALDDELHIRLSPGYYDLLANTPRVAHRNFVPLMVVDSVRFAGFDGFIKTSLDYVLGIVALLLGLPLMVLIALWLAVTSRGALFESWTTVGIGGRTFRAVVFRTQPAQRFARFLSYSGLHLLPLLFLVPLGRMSLVGPRPIVEAQRERYRRWLPVLATVKPGVSGPWAVVPVASLEEEMRATLYYIRNWTVWLDLQILVQTVLVVLRRRWARLGEEE